MEPKIERFIAALPAGKRELALEVRDVFLSASKKISEDIKWGNLTFIYQGNLAFIYTYPKVEYINLGFMKAVEMSDPKRMFEGTGKGMRHIKIREKKDIDKKQIKAWVKEAMELNEGGD